ncbi:MFS transporter [Kocuria sp.]|uniref:MFS transporter n=1 Tax=Kocuria sp. TaxID=1871328 RepID=UPI0026E050CA|nr:MFS transporter [Kocuria sp.]MDO5619059.1 MFS transporter [Kocuria sp.]
MKLSTAARSTLIMGSLVLCLSLGLRHGFGLFLGPVTEANDWSRGVFAFAIALQNLIWGVAQPIAGMLSDRFGAKKTILVGAVLYILGLVGMAVSKDPLAFTMAAGLLIGVGLAGTTMPVVFGAISRTMPAHKRSMAFGVAMSVGSLGQFAMMPGVLGLIGGVGWSQTLVIMSAAAALMVPLAFGMNPKPTLGERTSPSAAVGEITGAVTGPTAGQAFRLALRTRDFLLLSAAFFVCGFHVVFISTHLPAYISDNGLDPSLGSVALALIGLFNVLGSLAAGWLGSRLPKNAVLACIYGARVVAFALFLWLPVSTVSVLVFASVMGLLWLSTVPLTNGIVAVMFGVKNLAMLSGLVFVTHQVGSFLGGWLGGALYDATGSYTVAWWLGIVLGLVAMSLHLIIKERPVEPVQSQ